MFPSVYFQSFWDIILEITHNDVVSEINSLVVSTRVGKCQVSIMEILQILYLQIFLF